MDLSLALDTLRTATDEALQSRFTETILTLKLLGQRLQVKFISTTPATNDSNTPPPSDSGRDSLSSTAESIADHPSTYENTVASPPVSPNGYMNTMSRYRGAVSNVPVQPTANLLSKKQHRRKSQKIKNKNTVERLACAMQDHVLWLQETILIGDEIFSPKRDSTQDPRMEDYRRAEGTTIRSNQSKLLGLLSVRSLAKDFAQEISGEERLQTLTKFVLSVQSGEIDPNDCNSSQFKGRCRRVSEFLSRQPKLSAASDANRAVNKGLKHLVFERVLKERLDDLKLPNMCEAVSAILGLSIGDFNSLTLTQMPQLVDTLVSDNFSIYLRADDKPQGEKWHILDVIGSINEWFKSLQTRYNNVRMRESIPEFEWPGAKRFCYDNQTVGPQNSPYSSTSHQGASNLRTLQFNIGNTTLPEPENQNQVPDLSQNTFDFAIPPLPTSGCPRSDVNPSLENISPDELDHSFDYTFQGTPYGNQSIFDDIETQPADYTIPYDPLFSELASCLSVQSTQLFDSTFPPIFPT